MEYTSRKLSCKLIFNAVIVKTQTGHWCSTCSNHTRKCPDNVASLHDADNIPRLLAETQNQSNQKKILLSLLKYK